MAGSEDGSAWLWSLPSGTCLAVLGDHASPVTAGGFTPDGKQVVTVTEDGTLRIWNPKTATVQIKYVGQSDARFHSGAIHSLALSHDSQLALTGSMDASVKVSHLHSKKASLMLSPSGALSPSLILCRQMDRSSAHLMRMVTLSKPLLFLMCKSFTIASYGT